MYECEYTYIKILDSKVKRFYITFKVYGIRICKYLHMSWILNFFEKILFIKDKEWF